MSPIRPENRDRYPADWPQISQRIRFDRAGGRCECVGECGRGTHDGRCPNRHGHPAYGTGSTVVLTTAHLDHTPEHCDPANLRAMCNGCHLHYDRGHHAETRAATVHAARLAGGQEGAGAVTALDPCRCEHLRADHHVAGRGRCAACSGCAAFTGPDTEPAAPAGDVALW